MILNFCHARPCPYTKAVQVGIGATSDKRMRRGEYERNSSLRMEFLPACGAEM